MTLIQKLDNWIIKMTWHKSDTAETLEQKVYLVRNGVIASFFISINLLIMTYYRLFQLFMLASLLLLATKQI